MTSQEKIQINLYLNQINDKQIILFGASSRGKRVLNNLLDKGIDKSQLKFCDNDKKKWNKVINGIEVISLNDLANLSRDTCIIISSSINYEISEQLKGLGFLNVHYFHLLLFSEQIFEKYDLNFLQILKETRETCYMDSEEKFTLYSSIKIMNNLSGDVAEVGVYKGGSAKIICETKGNKNLYLFDTFEGYPETDKEDLLKKGWLGNTTLENVKNYLSQYDKVYFFKGHFPDTASAIVDKKFCFVHLDVDNYQTVMAALHFFWPRMVKDGRIVSHDYNAVDVPGVRKAFLEFFSNNPEKIIEIADTQVLVVK